MTAVAIIFDPDSSLKNLLLPNCPDGIELVFSDRPPQMLRLFNASPPDVILLSLVNPESADVLLQALLARPLSQFVPILLCSDDDLNPHHLSTEQGAGDAGAAGLICEPLSPERLFAFLQNHITNIQSNGSSGQINTLTEDLLDLPTSTLSFHDIELALEDTDAPQHFIENQSNEPFLIPSLIEPEFFSGGNAEVPPPSHHTLPPRQITSSSVSHPQFVPRLDASISLLSRKLKHARHEDYFVLLEVRRSSEPYEIEQAYNALRDRFSFAHFSSSLADQQHHQLNELLEALDDAYAVLADDQYRESYLRALLARPQQ